MLRQKAERSVQGGAPGHRQNVAELSTLTTKKLLHELQVHQIELEMQNDELLRAQAQLDAAKARYFDLYDLAPMGYCTVTDQGLIVEANLAAATLLGISRSSLTSKPLHRFLAKASQDAYYLCLKSLGASGMAQDCELQLWKETCDTHAPAPWVHLRMSAALSTEGMPVLRVVFHDISERKRLEAETQAKSLELERAWQLADKASRAKSEFLSSMTHELRSPLNAILGFAQLLTLGATPPTTTQKANIDEILRAGWYLLDLVDEVLDLSLMESGKMAVQLEPISVAGVVHDCQATLAPLAQEHGIEVHYHVPPAHWMLYADANRLKQVCINLLTNAIQYNRANGSIHVACTLPTPHTLRFSIADTGEGLAADKLSQLFQPFNRLGRQTQHPNGTGVGLAISKHLIELMGGTIGVQSTPGVGSTFWFELPTAAATGGVDA